MVMCAKYFEVRSKPNRDCEKLTKETLIQRCLCVLKSHKLLWKQDLPRWDARADAAVTSSALISAPSVSLKGRFSHKNSNKLMNSLQNV